MRQQGKGEQIGVAAEATMKRMRWRVSMVRILVISVEPAASGRTWIQRQ
jgi:hypothetical protein